MRIVLMMILALWSPLASALEMVMVEQPGCAFCKKWNTEIAPIYPKTELGAEAPLRRVSLDDAGDAIALARPVIFTPTFLFVEDDHEVARLEGYQSEDFFWALSEAILRDQLDIENPAK